MGICTLVIERRRYQVPTIPENYPQDFIGKVNEILSIPDSDIKLIHKPENFAGVILTDDIRNFTKTFEDNLYGYI